LLAASLADATRRRTGRGAFNQPPQSRIANTTIMVIAVINGRGNPVISLVALDEPPAHRRRYEMNLLSRRSVLAIAAVVDVALHSRSAPVAAKALAARHKLPPRHLETLLQGLVHAKILKGVRGPRGGYELARERRRITVSEIVRTAMSLSTADPEDLGANSILLERVIDPAVRKAGETFLANLDSITVEQMCETAEKSHVLDDEKVRGEFAI
jgi:Rrf2 family transcriptional regulator, iron-sulfur cluster assembly transcription factor